MAKKIIVLIVLSIAYANALKAQTEDKIVPTSPNSYVFEQYVNHPVTEYSGLPQIEIPLYEIKIKGLTIPIKLSYHAGGIRYNQECAYIENPTTGIWDGDVGAGWSIGAGGYRVTRSINGKPDDKTGMGGTPIHMYPESELEEHLISSTVKERDDYLSFLYFSPEKPSGIAYNGTYYDTEFDMFTYMLPTENGHFIIDRDGQAKAIESRTVKLRNNSNLEELSIVDDSGFTYYMGREPDNSTVFEYVQMGEGVATKYKSAWPVRRIVSPYNETVSFSYVPLSPRKLKVSPGIRIMEPAYYAISNHPYQTSQSASMYPRESLSFISKYDEMFISEIRSEQEVVTFKRGVGQIKNLIKEISIYNKAGILLKMITFEYSQPTINNWHVQLLSIWVKDANQTGVQKFSFEYYPPVADKFSNTVADQWGYYMPGAPAALSDGSYLFLHNEFKDYYIVGRVEKSHSPSRQKISENSTMLNRYTNNRTNNEKTPNSFALRKVIYPTGGSTEYVYDRHQYINSNGKKISGGGLRIKKIISIYDPQLPPLTTEYKYGKNEDGIGVANFQINSNHFISNSVSVNYVPMVNGYGATSAISAVTTLSEDILYSEKSDFNVNYSVVTKYQLDSETQESNGKVVSYYEIPRQYEEGMMSGNAIANNFLLGYYYRPNLQILRVNRYNLNYAPRLIRQNVYSQAGVLVQKDLLSYTETSDNKFYNGVKVSMGVDFSQEHYDRREVYNSALSAYDYVTSLFGYLKYSIYTGGYLLSFKEKVTYAGNDSIKQTYTYVYDSKGRILSEKEMDSRGENITQEYTYPALNTKLSEMNMLSTVVEKVTKNNSSETERFKTNYSANAYLPASLERSFSGAANMQTELFYDKYDNKGNLLQKTTKDGMKTTYLWSYKGKYPVAEIQNATLAEVEAQLGMSASALAQLETPDMNKIQGLYAKLPQSQISVFTYKPLIGVSSITNQTQMSNYYEYDAAGRLSFVKDNDCNKISGFEYRLNNGFQLIESHDITANSVLHASSLQKAGVNPTVLFSNIDYATELNSKTVTANIICYENTTLTYTLNTLVSPVNKGHVEVVVGTSSATYSGNTAQQQTYNLLKGTTHVKITLYNEPGCEQLSGSIVMDSVSAGSLLPGASNISISF